MVEDRNFSRSKKARETRIGIDSTGAEYWLVPFSNGKAGNRKFEIRNSKKQVPIQLQGMITDAATGTRMFEAWQDSFKNSKKSTKTATADE